MLENCPWICMHFNLHVSFSLKHKFCSHWMVRKWLAQKTDCLRCQSTKWVPSFQAGFSCLIGWYPVLWGDHFLESNGLFSIHFGWAMPLWPSYGWILSTLPTNFFCPLMPSSLPQFQPMMFTRHQSVNHNSNEPIHLFSRKWPLELLHTKPIGQSYIW